MITNLIARLNATQSPVQIVPPTGFATRLTVFVAAAMSFLAVFALALAFATGRIADRWTSELARSLTIRISAPAGQMAAQTEATLRVLETTPGVAVARALSADEQQALLAPWFGADIPLDTLPVPQLIEVVETDAGLDPDNLKLRLAGEAPGAILDDHGRWRAPLVQAAGRLSLFGWLTLGLIAAVTAAMVSLAASSALSANLAVIRTLRLIGAEDRYIGRAFVRRFTQHAIFGSLIGVLLGTVLVFLLPEAEENTGFLTGIGFSGWGWILPLIIPVLTAAVANGATWATANRALRRLA